MQSVSCTILALLLLVFSGGPAHAQYRTDAAASPAFRSDTLSLRIEFASGSTQVVPEYNGNDYRIELFRESLNSLLSLPGAFMSGVFLRTVASPEGSVAANIRISTERADNVRAFICNEFGLSPFNVHVTSDGENWKEFEEHVSRLSIAECPWRDEALAIIRGEGSYDFGKKGDVKDSRKEALRALDGGKAWSYMSEHVFPNLRAAYGDALFFISVPVSTKGGVPVVEVPVESVVRDTVVVKEFIETEYDGKTDRKFLKRVEGKKFLFSARTNIVAIPLINVGVEFPFSKHFSIGFDYYYPWLRRNALHDKCVQMMAYDMDVRYWLPSDKYPEQSRLLGHSFGVYGAGGHYDFEMNYSGHQGTFFNIGFDWKYSWPIFHGAMHMEVELGLGMIYSDAQPYNVYDDYGKAFRVPGQRKIVRWYGPTRAQFNLCVPFYRTIRNYRKSGK